MNTNKEFLNWIADRFVHKYKESENVDFVLSLRRRASEIDKLEQILKRPIHDSGGDSAACFRSDKAALTGKCDVESHWKPYYKSKQCWVRDDLSEILDGK